LVGVVLFFILFYQIRLYSDMFEQVYFFVTGFWGWWLWTHPKRAEDADAKKGLKIVRAARKELAISFAITVTGTLALGAAMSRIHLLLPSFFTVPADYPYTDAFTTVMSFVATVLMMRKRVECWHYWIIIDIIGVWLYYVKGVRFISLEYAIFLVMATGGLLSWRKLPAASSSSYGLQNKPGRREVLPAA
jgi:nicotinamide mononucleotide transporter